MKFEKIYLVKLLIWQYFSLSSCLYQTQSCKGIKSGKRFAVGIHIIVDPKVAHHFSGDWRFIRLYPHELIFMAQSDFFDLGIFIELLSVTLSVDLQFDNYNPDRWQEIASFNVRKLNLTFKPQEPYFVVFIIPSGPDGLFNINPAPMSACRSDSRLANYIILKFKIDTKLLRQYFYFQLAKFLGIPQVGGLECPENNCFNYLPPQSPEKVVRWSKCSMDAIVWLKNRAELECFPKIYRNIKNSVCGNNIIEDGEECDCPPLEVNCWKTFCDPLTCKRLRKISPYQANECPALPACDYTCLSSTVKSALSGIGTIVIITGTIAIIAGGIMAFSININRL